MSDIVAGRAGQETVKRTGILAGVSDVELAYSLFRFASGVNLFFHGAMRIITGVVPWADKQAEVFVNNPLLPMWFVKGFLYILPSIEVALGAVIAVGLFTGWALLAGFGLMFVLTFGNLTRQDWGTVGNNMHYVLYYALMIAGQRYDVFSLDRWKKR